MSANRWTGAKCTRRLDLPWISDTTPSQEDMDAMSAVCAQCPVLLQCAHYALSDAAGGFYAGIWLPWDKSNSLMLRGNRRRARNALRQMVSV